MARVHDVSRNSLPPAAGGSINGMKVLMAIVLLLIAVAAVAGVLFAMSTGQPAVAIIVGLCAAAFFCRVGC